MTGGTEGRVAVVTGGTRGIGQAIAARLAAGGFRTVAAARARPRVPLEDGVEFASCDVADPSQVRSLFAGLGSRYGRVDVLVNNAGLAGSNPLDAGAGDELWHEILGTNLHGTYHCCKAALPLLPDGTGRVINIASTLGLRGVPDQTAYCAAKHGVIGLTRSLALLLAPRGITVNAICPGWVETEMAARRLRELGLLSDQAAQGVPAGRLVRPDEVAGVVAFLIQDTAAGMTGLAIPVDGGRLACA
jgi:NAD(P)-dependent dehydrogenase (short-subunit alcohol dehydrogenase family)